MSEALATTFRVLEKTDNEAAVRVLSAALDSPHRVIQNGALRTILRRRSVAGGRELLRRLHALPERWKDILRENHGRMTRTLRDAILGTDRELTVNACRAVVWFREYDLIPSLLNLLEDPHQQNADLAGKTLLEVTSLLYAELAAPRDYADPRDPQRVREHVISRLEASVNRFDRHRRREAIEAFLLVVDPQNATLKRILGNPHDAGFLVTLDVLSNSSQGGVMRLLLSLLDDPHAPSALLSVVARRADLKFVQHLLGKIGHKPSSAVIQNIKRIKSIGWLNSKELILGALDDAAQCAAVELVVGSGVARQQAFPVIEHLILHGKPGGRRAAAEALHEFSGAEANDLVISALDDPEPEVQAIAVGQLRCRGILGGLARLVTAVDSPHAAVRKAARENLGEFKFERFLRAFDMLDEEVRHSTGMLVKKIDPQTVPLLETEMKSLGRTRRLRGLAVARTMGVAEQLQPLILDLLTDEDHLVRAQAAATLADCPSQASRRALQNALADRSYLVQEAARLSLSQQAQFADWRAGLSDPRD